jgi:hypothetical protein
MVSTRRQAALGQTSTDSQSSAANNAHPRGVYPAETRIHKTTVTMFPAYFQRKHAGKASHVSCVSMLETRSKHVGRTLVVEQRNAPFHVFVVFPEESQRKHAVAFQHVSTIFPEETCYCWCCDICLKRSGRVQELTWTPGPTSATESEGEEEPSSPEARSPRDGAKETTTTKRAPKRRKGKWSASMKKVALLARESKLSLLRSFMQLPLDIILEVRRL